MDDQTTRPGGSDLPPPPPLGGAASGVPSPPPPPSSPPPPYATPDEPGPARSRRRWLVPTVVGVIALLVGMGVGAASSLSSLEEKDDEIAALTSERDDYRARVEDRESQQAADEAAAARVEAEREEAERRAQEEQAAAEQKAAEEQAAAERKAAEEQAAAERKAAEEQAAAEQAAADEQARQQAEAAEAERVRNTIPGNGIFEIGGEKNAGTYRTGGPAPGRGFANCYYAVLSSPTGSGIDNIVDNNNIQGPGIVTLRAGQFFESNGCQEWTRS